MNERVEQRFGAYQAMDIIERGDTAVVYRGYQPSLGRTVAIRVLLKGRNPQFAARFRHEARAVAQLEHHNILPVYDYGEQDGTLYVVTQYIEHNLTLHNILGDPMEPLATLRLMSGVLEGLDYAHRHNVVHRNIKPTSILLPLPDWPVLADFGIARFATDDETLTMPGISLDSAQYMAPEFLASAPTDSRTDIYALGAVLYHMVVGHPPFEAATPLAVLQEHVARPLPDPRTHNPALPDNVADLITRALAKTPAERFPSVRAMLEAIQQAMVQIELSSGDHYIEQIYQAGVYAFAEGDWNRALDQLRRVHERSPQYTSAAKLITFAQHAQRRAQQHAQAELVRLHKQSTLLPTERTTIGIWSQPVPRTNRHDVSPSEDIDSAGTDSFQQMMPQSPSRRRLRTVYYVTVIVAALALVAAVWMLRKIS